MQESVAPNLFEQGLFSLKAYRLNSYILVGTVYGLMLLGGYVKSIGAGLACPDWPLCYGQIFPSQKYWFNNGEFNWGLWAEYTHRLVAGIVILMIFHLFIAGWLNREHFPQIRTVAWLFFAIIIIQSILGGLTVLHVLHPLIVTAHLGMGIFSYTVTLINAFLIHTTFKQIKHPVSEETGSKEKQVYPSTNF